MWGAECQIIFIDLDTENSIHYIVNFFGQYFVGKTDLSGVSTIGAGHLFNNQSLYLYQAKRLPPNEILMAGKLPGKALFARLTASGDTISVARFAQDPDSGIASTAIYDLEFDVDGNVLNLCKLSSLIHATILKTDIDGNIISRSDWVDSNFTSAGPVRYIGESSEGGYEILMLVTSNFSQTGPRIYLYNNDEISFRDDLDYFSDYFMISLISEGNIRHFLNRDSNGTYIIKANTSGEILWTWTDSRLWGLPISIYRYNNLSLYESKVIAVGVSNNNSILYAVELLPNGQVELEDETYSPVVNALSAYPNPMKDKLTIRTPSEVGENTYLSIHNIRGQRVRSMILNGEIVEWDGKDARGADCPNGVYAIRIASNNTVYYITKIK